MITRVAAILAAASVATRTSLGAGVGVCEPVRRAACESAYLDCKLSSPVSDKDAICGCAAIYYGACLPTAGCATADEMASCIDELMQWDCQETSMCGNDCTPEDGDPLLPADSILLPVNNFGANYLQLSVCSKQENAAMLNHFGQIIVERCNEDDFRVCDLWVAPHTLTAVAFPPHVTRLRVEQCVSLTSSATNDDDGGGAGGEEEWECLDDPAPMEYYGTTAYYGTAGGDDSVSLSYWPLSVDVDHSVAALCQEDSHCPGSFCDLLQQPRVCAPKMGEHFLERGSHFLDPRWKILELADG